MGTVKFDHGEYVRIWNGSLSIDEVSSSTGLSRKRCKHRAQYLRKMGHELRAMRPQKNLRRNLQRKFSVGEFVRMWNSAESASEAAQKMGIPQYQASARANELRRSGLPDVRVFPRGRPRGAKSWSRPRILEFIRIWNESSSVMEVGQRTRCPYPSQRAWYLRGKGHELKRLGRSGR